MRETFRSKVTGHFTFWQRVVVLAVHHYIKLHSSLLAAAIAYYALVCLAPLAILTVIALQAWLGSIEEAYDYFQQLIGAVFPAPTEILTLLGEGLHTPNAVLGGVAGLVALTWAALRLFETIERGLSIVWAERPQRGIVIRKLVATATLVSVGILGGAFLLTMTVTAWLQRTLEQFNTGSELLTHILWHPHYVTGAAIFAISLLALFMAYKLLPEGRVSNRGALLATISTAVLAQVAGRVFNFAVAGIVKLSIIYGTLTWAIAFCLWAYWGATLLLFGAHLGWAYDTERADLRTQKADSRRGSDK